MECIAYKKGYKYQLSQIHVTNIDIKPAADIDTDYIKLNINGELTIKKGYAWDGPSGPAPDITSIMRGSLVHDALYQLMRNEYLDKEQYRKPADRLIQKMCKEDGMLTMAAWIVYQAVKHFGDPSADPANKKPIIKAPKSCQISVMK